MVRPARRRTAPRAVSPEEAPLDGASPEADSETPGRLFQQFIHLKKTGDAMLAEAAPYKKALMDVLEKEGVADSDGHVWYQFPDPIAGHPAMKRERRVRTEVDAAAVKEILTAAGLWGECHQTIQVLDEDAVFAAVQRGALTDSDLEQMFPKKIIWAFVPSKVAAP